MTLRDAATAANVRGDPTSAAAPILCGAAHNAPTRSVRSDGWCSRDAHKPWTDSPSGRHDEPGPRRTAVLATPASDDSATPAAATFDATDPDRARRQPARRPQPPPGRRGARSAAPAGRGRARRRDRRRRSTPASDLVEVLVGRSDVAPEPARQALRPPGVDREPDLPPPRAGLPGRDQGRCSTSSTRSSSTRRAGSGPASRCRCSPRRPHRPTRCSATRARWPRRSRPGAAACVSGAAAPRPRHPSQRRHAVDGRHPPVHRRRQPRRHPRPGRAPHRGVRAHPVRTGRQDVVRPTARRDPAADQQVLHLRPRARAAASSSTWSAPASRTSR